MGQNALTLLGFNSISNSELLGRACGASFISRVVGSRLAEFSWLLDYAQFRSSGPLDQSGATASGPEFGLVKLTPTVTNILKEYCPGALAASFPEYRRFDLAMHEVAGTNASLSRNK